MSVLNSREGSYDPQTALLKIMSKRNQFMPAFLSGIHKSAETKFYYYENVPNQQGPIMVTPRGRQLTGNPKRVHRYQSGTVIPAEDHSYQHRKLYEGVRRGEVFFVVVFNLGPWLLVVFLLS